ncbi:MAG: hypothetical protein WC788_01205 [Candidatus Paceibacterota bacterium]
MHEINKIDENISFPEAIGLVVRIRDGELTLASLRKEASDGLIFLIKDKLGWIAAPGEDSKIEISAKVQEYVTEYRSMIVLENIKNRMEIGNNRKGMKKSDFENNAPPGTVDFLINNSLVKIVEYPAEQIIHMTDKGELELKEYFKKEYNKKEE